MGNSLTRKKKTPSELREVLAQNINRLMEQRYKEVGDRPKALAKDAGVSLSTVQRTLSRASGATIDTVEAFSRVFGLAPYQLLMPGWLGVAATPPAPSGPVRGREVRRPERARYGSARRRTA